MQVGITCNCDSTLESIQYESGCITLPGQLNLDTVTDDGHNSELVGAAQIIVTARCKSVSHAEQGSRHYPNWSRAQVEQDHNSHPGQMNLDT